MGLLVVFTLILVASIGAGFLILCIDARTSYDAEGYLRIPIVTGVVSLIAVIILASLTISNTNKTLLKREYNRKLMERNALVQAMEESDVLDGYLVEQIIDFNEFVEKEKHAKHSKWISSLHNPLCADLDYIEIKKGK